MKIYITKINESWVVDNFRNEFIEKFPDLITNSLKKADIVWIIAPWLFPKFNLKKFNNKKILCSFYHIDEKNQEDIDLFRKVEPFVDQFHTISKLSENNLRKFTTKKINEIPFWVNTENFFTIPNKEKLRQELGFLCNEYLIGSFQRDSEGFNTKLPKLIKGPDVFINIASRLKLQHENLKVVLTGVRRDYLISELEKLGIKYKYYELIDVEVLNRLYNVLDLYIVSSRLEGGPQAIAECATIKTPVISSKVGVAPQILHEDSLFDVDNINSFFGTKIDTEVAKSNVAKLETPFGFDRFIEMFNNLNES